MFGSFRTKRHAAARIPATRRLFVGHLEDRSLPSVSATMFDTTLVIRDTGAGARADNIRIFGDTQKGTDVVRVYDNQIEIGVFTNVKNIDVEATGNSTLAIDLNTYTSIDNVAVKEMGLGTNIIRFGQGRANAVKIAGNSGTEAVSVNGLTAASFSVDTGLGSDQVSFGAAALKQVNVFSAETVELSGTRAGDVTIDNRGGPLSVTTSASLGSLQVFAGSGSVGVGGSVAGDVTFSNFGSADTGERLSGATLKLTGKVGGALRMTGTELADNVVFASGSAVFGNVELMLGAGNDAASFAGNLGSSGTSVSVDLGDGDDSVELMAPANLMATKTLIAMGAGNDVATVSTSGTQLSGLSVDGGTGKDTLRTGGSEATFNNSGFERFE